MASWLEDAWRDAGLAVRQARRTPVLAAVVVMSLALGIGANTALFTLVDAVLLKSLPVRDPQGLVMLGHARSRGVGVGVAGRSVDVYSHHLYKHLEDVAVFDGLCAVQSGDERISVRRAGPDGAQPALAKFVSGNYFQVLGVNAAVGRTLLPSDDTPNARSVAVVSFPYWKSVLNQDSSAIGATVDVNGTPVTIVGVAPPAFYGETIQADPPSFWIPVASTRTLTPERNLVDEPDRYWLYLLGRLKPAMAATQAEARVTLAVQHWLRSRDGAARSADAVARMARTRVEITSAGSGVPHMRRQYAPALRLLLGTAMAVLLIACANIAGLLLARGIARRNEHALRLALGATRGRLMRQSLAESFTLAFVGGAVALLVAANAADLLLALVFGRTAYVPIQTMPDARVLAFTFALSCATAVAFGVVPAIRQRSHIAGTMSDGRFRLGKGLIIGQVTVALVVLAGAGSLAHSLANLAGQPFGFDRAQVLVVSVDPKLARYTLGRLGRLYEQLEARLNALPGVTSASFSHYSPFNRCCWAFSVTVPGYTPSPDESMSAVLNRVSSRYFDTLGTKLLRGRVFDARDTATSRRVVIVSHAFVERFFPNGDPIGRTFTIDSEGANAEREIVGVVEDAKYDDPRDEQRPMAFLPFLQMNADEPAASSDYQSNFLSAIEVRVAGDAGEVATRVRHTLGEIDSALPISSVEMLSDHVGAMVRPDRAVFALAAVFGSLALLLTCIGLYGLMAYLVQRRTKEIGIRMALGADRGSVLAMMVREALTQAGAGILIGAPAAFFAVRLIRNQLYGVSPTDPRHAATAALLLIASLAVASYLPARRAARIEPVRALRQE